MNVNPEVILNACHWTALILVIALPILLPSFPAAAGAAFAVYMLTRSLRVVVGLWKLRFSRNNLKPLCRWSFRQLLRCDFHCLL